MLTKRVEMKVGKDDQLEMFFRTQNLLNYYIIPEKSIQD